MSTVDKGHLVGTADVGRPADAAYDGHPVGAPNGGHLACTPDGGRPVDAVNNSSLVGVGDFAPTYITEQLLSGQSVCMMSSIIAHPEMFCKFKQLQHFIWCPNSKA